MTTKYSKAKKAKKASIITLGVIKIKVTFNNTIVTFTDAQGNVFLSCSSGQIPGFKNSKKSSPYPVQLIMEKLGEKARLRGLKTVSIEIKGPGSQREASLRAILYQNFIVTSIRDKTPIPHNGCRPLKKRRV